TTYERDSGTGETGLDYAQFRHYSSGQGRFVSADLLGGRIGIPQSHNRYSYSLNDPVNLIDPTGLFWLLAEQGWCVTVEHGQQTCGVDLIAIWFDDASGGGDLGGGGGGGGGQMGSPQLPNLFPGSGSAPQLDPLARRVSRVRDIVKQILKAINLC